MILGEGAWKALEGVEVEILELGQTELASVGQQLDGCTVDRLGQMQVVLLGKPLPQGMTLLVHVALLVYSQEMHKCSWMGLEIPILYVLDDLLDEGQDVAGRNAGSERGAHAVMEHLGHLARLCAVGDTGGDDAGV